MKTQTCFAAILLCAAGAAQSLSPTDDVVLAEPLAHARVACQADLTGTATPLADGRHLWSFAIREDYEGVWVPQNEAKIDPVNKKYKVTVQLGERHDVGKNFFVALAVVDQSQHIALQAYRRHALISGQWRPIEMPPTTSPPLVRTVTKIAHDCE